jgi:hypothetical protein
MRNNSAHRLKTMKGLVHDRKTIGTPGVPFFFNPTNELDRHGLTSWIKSSKASFEQGNAKLSD